MTISENTAADKSNSGHITSQEPQWARRFRAARVMLPEWAIDAPERCLYVSNSSGKFELHAWDRSTNSHWQLTDRPNGTTMGALSPDGQWVWWFNDSDGDEFGTWQREPFPVENSPQPESEPAVPGLEPSYPAGLDIGNHSVLIGRSADDGTTIHLQHQGNAPTILYQSACDASAGPLSRDESLACIVHSEHGDSRHPSLRVLSIPSGETVADLDDTPGRGLYPLAFSPISGDQRLLVMHERRERPELLIWDPLKDSVQELDIDLPGEISGTWFPAANSLLVRQDHHGRSKIYQYFMDTGQLSTLDTPPGVVTDATARPDGAVEFSWSSAAEPPVIRQVGGGVVLAAAGPEAPSAQPVIDAWVDGPGGPIHALISYPPDSVGVKKPYATVFLIHGGPQSADIDTFRAKRPAYVDSGYCVIQVNYRGSTGYGTGWRDALEGRPGLTELEDIAAVRDWAIENGIADPQRCVLSGGSWGGYLTLLGLGTQPDVWAAGVAAVPVADYVTAFKDESEQLRAFDRSLFGGSPEEIPEVYQASSPITYVEKVVAPVMILAGVNDPRCPLQQILNYVDRLEELNKPHEVYRYEAGHGSLVIDEQIRQTMAEIDFCQRQVKP